MTVSQNGSFPTQYEYGPNGLMRRSIPPFFNLPITTWKYEHNDRAAHISIESTGKIKYYHPDLRGSAKYVTDDFGNVLETRLYEPYGQEYQSSGSSGYLPYRFNDRRDETNGTLRFPLRNLSDQNYHWTALDPIIRTSPSASVKNIGNPFSYAGYDPVNNVDLLGAANIPIFRPIPFPGEDGSDEDEKSEDKRNIEFPVQTVTVIVPKSDGSLLPSFEGTVIGLGKDMSGKSELKEKVRFGGEDGPLVAYEDVDKKLQRPLEIIAVSIPEQAKVMAPYLGKRFCVRIPDKKDGDVRGAVILSGFTIGKGKNRVTFVARLGRNEYIYQTYFRLIRSIVMVEGNQAAWVRKANDLYRGNAQARNALNELPGKRCFGNNILSK